jgi:hypothetical protein
MWPDTLMRMNVDAILQTFNAREVEYLLIGGMNFLLRHQPVLTYDIDLWVRDTPANLARCDAALQSLGAEWGPTEDAWKKVAEQPGWLSRQSVFCLTSASGAIDVFRTVTGLPSWEEANERAYAGSTAAGVAYRGLCDEDMILCQLALPEGQQRHDRIAALRRSSTFRNEPDGS